MGFITNIQGKVVSDKVLWFCLYTDWSGICKSLVVMWSLSWLAAAFSDSSLFSGLWHLQRALHINQLIYLIDLLHKEISKIIGEIIWSYILWKQHLRRFTQQQLGGAKQLLLIWTVLSYEISIILIARAIHYKRCAILYTFESAKVLVGFCPSPFPFHLPPCPYSTLNLTVKPWQALPTDNHFLLHWHMHVQKRC